VDEDATGPLGTPARAAATVASARGEQAAAGDGRSAHPRVAEELAAGDLELST